MTSFDYAALIIVGLSMLLSVMRGLVQEVLALVAWVLAFWLATQYSGALAQWIPSAVPTEGLRFMAAFVGIFFMTWLLSAIVRITLNQFIQATGFKPVDRILGAGFGLVRGFLLVLTVVLLAGFTSAPKEVEWRNAMFSPLFEQSAAVVKPWLPATFASRISYD